MIVLSINPYHPNVSAAIAKDNRITAFGKEGDFLGLEHCSSFPLNSILFCLQKADVKLDDIDYILIPKSPFVHPLERFIVFIKTNFRSGKKRIRSNLRLISIKKDIAKAVKQDTKAKVIFVEHHKAHLADAYYNSGFDNALVFSCDGSGDMTTTMWGMGKGKDINVKGRIKYPHSLGMLYTAFTQALGFTEYGSEYRTTELSSKGMPFYVDIIRKIIHIKKNGKFALDMSYFDIFKKGVVLAVDEGRPILNRLYSDKLYRLLSNIKNRHDIAASLQNVVEEVILNLLNKLRKKYRQNNVCLSGGIFLNKPLCERIIKSNMLDNVYVSKEPADAGTAVGALFYFYNMILKEKLKYEDSIYRPVFLSGSSDELSAPDGSSNTPCRI